jgi:hypothetical protein
MAEKAQRLRSRRLGPDTGDAHNLSVRLIPSFDCRHPKHPVKNFEYDPIVSNTEAKFGGPSERLTKFERVGLR